MFIIENMLESLSYITYLLRYPLAFIAIGVATTLLWRSLTSLVQRFRQHGQPAHGFFLMAQAAGAGDVVESFSLYPTTLVGRSSSSDIRFKDKSVLKRHAVIYLYQGRWYIRPATDGADLKLNDRQVRQPRIIKNEDIIQLADKVMVFVDERDSAEAAGQDFAGSIADWRYENLPEIPIPTDGCWFLTSLFFGLGNLAVLFIFPQELYSARPFYMILVAAFFFFSQLGYVLLPRWFENFDRASYCCFIFLCSIGFVVQARFAFIDRIKPEDWEQAQFLNYLQKDFLVQSGLMIAGIVILPLIILLVQRTTLLEKTYYLCLLATPALYLVSLVLGRGGEEWGANLWISLPGGFSLQLTEFAKISYLIVLACFFKIRPPLKTQILFAAWAGFNYALIMLLPDLGSMMILLPVTLIVFVIMTSEYLKTALILVGGSTIFFLAYQILPYVRNRLEGWLTLWTETNANNEQIIFGLQAVARGGVVGRGLGVGNPRSIPLASSDMVFSVVAEEMGILTGLAILIFFIAVWLRSAYFASKVRDGFSSSLILAIASYFFIEAAVVIGGTTGLIPLTGATLPMIAKGGSSIIAKWLLVGMLLGLCSRNEEGAYHR